MSPYTVSEGNFASLVTLGQLSSGSCLQNLVCPVSLKHATHLCQLKSRVEHCYPRAVHPCFFAVACVSFASCSWVYSVCYLFSCKSALHLGLHVISQPCNDTTCGSDLTVALGVQNYGCVRRHVVTSIIDKLCILNPLRARLKNLFQVSQDFILAQ